MIEYKVGTPRNQIYLFQHTLEELIEPDNVVRFIDAYVESLEMAKLGFRMHENSKGAPAYRPQVKLKIYIYGYFNRIRSSRLLETECGRNREMMWLVEGLRPDFKTIADFRKDNRESAEECVQRIRAVLPQDGADQYEATGGRRDETESSERTRARSTAGRSLRKSNGPSSRGLSATSRRWRSWTVGKTTRGYRFERRKWSS